MSRDTGYVRYAGTADGHQRKENMPSLTLSRIEKQSKGRNGWMHPAEANLIPMKEMVCVEIWSKRKDGNPPIDLYLSYEDAGKLGRMLIALPGAGGCDCDQYCDCADRSWRGRKHDSACPLAGQDRLYVCPKCGHEHEPTDMPNECECGMVPK